MKKILALALFTLIGTVSVSAAGKKIKSVSVSQSLKNAQYNQKSGWGKLGNALTSKKAMVLAALAVTAYAGVQNSSAKELSTFSGLTYGLLANGGSALFNGAKTLLGYGQQLSWFTPYARNAKWYPGNWI